MPISVPVTCLMALCVFLTVFGPHLQKVCDTLQSCFFVMPHCSCPYFLHMFVTNLPVTMPPFHSCLWPIDGRSRSEFRKLFPQTPNTGDALETQQRALLMQQEEYLRDMRERSKLIEDHLLELYGT